MRFKVSAPRSSETATQTRALGAIALDVPVAINRVTADVDAFIDRQVVDAGNVSVEATTEGNIRAIVVGASIAVQGRAGNSNVNFAGVGAVAINTIDQHAAALIRESDVTTNGIDATNWNGRQRGGDRKPDDRSRCRRAESVGFARTDHACGARGDRHVSRSTM